MSLDVLVTGADGALGKTVVAKLRERGKKVLACGHSPGSCDSVWDVTIPDGPATDLAPHTIVHTAARRAPLDEKKRDEQLWAVNVEGTARVIEWALRNRVKRIVLTSSALVYGSWDEPRREEDEPNAAAAGYYALSKWASERIALTACQAGCEVAVLRMSSLYGPAYKTGLIRHFLSQAEADKSIRVDPPLDDAFDLLYLTDAAATVANVVDMHASATWNVGGGSPTSLMEIARTCASVYGASVEVSRRKARRKPRVLNWVNDSRARRELGHRNAVSLEQGVREIAAR